MTGVLVNRKPGTVQGSEGADEENAVSAVGLSPVVPEAMGGDAHSGKEERKQP